MSDPPPEDDAPGWWPDNAEFDDDDLDGDLVHISVILEPVLKRIAAVMAAREPAP